MKYFPPLPSLESSPVVTELANKFDSSAKSALNDDGGAGLRLDGDVDVLIAAFEAPQDGRTADDGDRHEANCESLELLFCTSSARLREGDS